MVKLYMFFLSLETSTVALRTVLDELLCFFFCPEFDILSIFFQESFVFAFSFAFRRKFAPKIPAKFPRNRPFSPRICLFKSHEISLFSPRIIRSPVITTITTCYLQNFQDGLQILVVRGFRNRLKKFFKKSLMPAFMFLRTCEDFSYKSSSMKSVRAAITFVSFARHHTTKHL